MCVLANVHVLLVKTSGSLVSRRSYIRQTYETLFTKIKIYTNNQLLQIDQSSKKACTGLYNVSTSFRSPQFLTSQVSVEAFITNGLAPVYCRVYLASDKWILCIGPTSLRTMEKCAIVLSSCGLDYYHTIYKHSLQIPTKILFTFTLIYN